MPSAYDEFVSDFLNANSWAQRKDGPPLFLLDKLSPEERALAESELLQRLDTDDTWPILGLAHLRSEKSIPNIQELARRAGSGVLPAIAEALFILTGSTALESKVIKIARNPLIHFGSRIDAVIALENLATATAREALEELKTNGNYLVAYNAKEALFRIGAVDQ